MLIIRANYQRQGWPKSRHRFAQAMCPYQKPCMFLTNKKMIWCHYISKGVVDRKNLESEELED